MFQISIVRTQFIEYVYYKVAKPIVYALQDINAHEMASRFRFRFRS